MNVGNGAPRHSLFQVDVEIVDFAGLDQLHRSSTKHRDDVATKKLLIAFDRAITDEAAAAADILVSLLAIEQAEPAIDPCSQSHLVGRNMFADVT